MKILYTTDLHFNTHWFEWIAKEQNNYDVFCITGDFLEDRKEESLAEQIEWITQWMKEFKKPLFICSGNHDIEELDNNNWFNKISKVHSDNSIKTLDGIRFACMPYLAPEFYEFDNCDVLLYHIPPANTKVSTHNKTNDDWGDKELTRVLKNGIIKPKILLCGHMHYPIDNTDKINDTIIYNVGVDKYSDIPNHHIIEI